MRQAAVSPRSLVLNRDYARRDPQKLAYLKGCLSPKRSLWVAEIWPPSGKAPYGYTRKEKKYITIRWPAAYQSCTQNQHFPSSFFRLWAAKPAPEPSPEVPKLRGTPRYSGAGAETPCFASSFHPDLAFSSRFLQLGFTGSFLFSLSGFWKLRNFLRLINASMKEAKANRHDDFLKDFS